ncbi:MAG: hypothetical protein KDL10_11270, partial [Kiritimatiellae bacterium]|nr:hypothetical protein [Kiritimatiellia bacterium]
TGVLSSRQGCLPLTLLLILSLTTPIALQPRSHSGYRATMRFPYWFRVIDDPCWNPLDHT